MARGKKAEKIGRGTRQITRIIVKEVMHKLPQEPKDGKDKDKGK